MGLACSQARLLTLTARKGDIEHGISIFAMKKGILAKEMTDLSSEYYSKCTAKQISFYHKGQYNEINYGYLMGYGSAYNRILDNDKYAIKDNNSMVLCDYKGQVVLSKDYADAITSVLGASAMGQDGRGGNFSQDKIPAILAALIPGVSEETFITVMQDGEVNKSYESDPTNLTTGEQSGVVEDEDISAETKATIQRLLDFYLPIFLAASSNGWTTEYNKEMQLNDSYVSDALVSGVFQLETVDSYGQYDDGSSLTYFVTTGDIQQNNTSEHREELLAWYNAEKERITEKESYIDIQMKDLSTELEVVKTEIQSIKSIIEDATSSVFDWGSS